MKTTKSKLAKAVARLREHAAGDLGAYVTSKMAALLLADWTRLREGHAAHKEHVESLESELARLRERDAKVRALVKSVHDSITPDEESSDIDRAEYADLGEALALLREEP